MKHQPKKITAVGIIARVGMIIAGCAITLLLAHGIWQDTTGVYCPSFFGESSCVSTVGLNLYLFGAPAIFILLILFVIDYKLRRIL